MSQSLIGQEKLDFILHEMCYASGFYVAIKTFWNSKVIFHIKVFHVKAQAHGMAFWQNNSYVYGNFPKSWNNVLGILLHKSWDKFSSKLEKQCELLSLEVTNYVNQHTSK